LIRERIAHSNALPSADARIPLKEKLMVDRLFRALCHIAGVDYERLRSCSLGDRQFATRIGLQLLFSSTFLFSIFASSLLIGFGDDPITDCIVVAMAFITAGVVLLVDIQIVQSDFYHHGFELARDRGLDQKGYLWAKIKRPATVSLRLLLSMTIAFAFATFFELRLFGSDIKRQIDEDYRKTNAVIFREVEATYDANVSLIDIEISHQAAALAVLNRQEELLRQKLFGNSETDREIEVMTDKFKQLSIAKQAADTEALRREGDAVNEKNGVKETAEHSGKKGEGYLYRNATERARLATLESARLVGEIADVRFALSAVRDRRERQINKSNEFIGAGLRKINEEVATTHSRRDELNKKREQAILDRENRILAIAQEQPEFAPKTDGFLARVEALETLKEKPEVARITFWTTIVIMAVEVSAVLGKVFFSTPTLYAVRTALEFENAVEKLVMSASVAGRDNEAAAIRKDIEIEVLRQELATKRASRRTKEEAMQQLYPDSNDNWRDAS
jgi:Domain of unknown function (DUF4407)